MPRRVALPDIREPRPGRHQFDVPRQHFKQHPRQSPRPLPRRPARPIQRPMVTLEARLRTQPYRPQRRRHRARPLLQQRSRQQDVQTGQSRRAEQAGKGPQNRYNRGRQREHPRAGPRFWSTSDDAVRGPLPLNQSGPSPSLKGASRFSRRGSEMVMVE